jgi:hypothetical protein
MRIFPEREAVLALGAMDGGDSFCRVGNATASWFQGQYDWTSALAIQLNGGEPAI